MAAQRGLGIRRDSVRQRSPRSRMALRSPTPALNKHLRRFRMNALRFGRSLGQPGQADQLEWLVTNGIGGYACGTVSGVLTRRYHGLLLAALERPLGRTLLLAKLGERLERDGEWIQLDADRWVSGAITPGPPVHLEPFQLDGAI